jgi:hypothetical protein
MGRAVSDFDPIRALREEIAGLADIHKVIAVAAREAGAQLGDVEARHNSLLKLDTFLVGLLKEYRARLKALEDAAAQ